MALAIASVPVLQGEVAERFEQQMCESEAHKGEVDFSNQIETARKILIKADLI